MRKDFGTVLSVPKTHSLTSPTKESKLLILILLPVILGLLVSALVGLQLFQDGSSYLLELLISHSAVRHERLSIFLFQAPTIFLLKVLHRLQFDALITLPIVRLAFNLNYALTPLISLILSWLVVRKKEERLFIWAVLIILFINLVNFSWVSELLISVQLSCPLLLALLQNPRSKTFWILVFLLTPFIFFLHPLVITIYLVMAAGSAYIAYRQSAYRSSARLSMIIYLLAAVLRGVYSLFALSAYEVGFLAADETRAYLITTSTENILFLVVAVEISFSILLARTIIHSNSWLINLWPWFISLQSWVLLLLTLRFFLSNHSATVVLMSCLGIVAFVHVQHTRTNTLKNKWRLLYSYLILLAMLASSLLLAQYLWYGRSFPLKTGLALFASLLIMILAAIDRPREHMPDEHAWRMKLAAAFSFIFASIIIGKSLMWQASVSKLEYALQQAESSCVEFPSTDFQWLQKSSHTIINNWSLPSLALVIQDQTPRKLLLAQNDCQLFYDSGMVQIDPWSVIPEEHLTPPLD